MLRNAVMPFLDRLLTSALVAAGLAMSALSVLDVSAFAGESALYCLLFCLLFCVPLLFRRGKKIYWLALPLSAAAWFILSGSGPIDAAIRAGKALLLSATGGSAPIYVYARDIALLLALVSACVGMAFTGEGSSLSAIAVSTFGMALVNWYVRGATSMLWALPLALAGLIIAAKTHPVAFHPAKAAPVGLILALCALLIAPMMRFTSPALVNAAEDVKNFVRDYLFFTDSRDAFSLLSQGYQPLGETQLGGAAAPSDAPVMRVYGSGTIYLRGVVKDTYTGRFWYDSISANRYAYQSLRFNALRDDVLDRNLLKDADIAEKSVRVHMLSQDTSTLFTPQRVTDLTLGNGMVAYFNLASELFITRDLVSGDEYAASFLPLDEASARVQALIEAGGEDARYAEIEEKYLSLPEHLQRELYDLAARAAGNGSDFTRARNIEEYLKTHYTYTLTPATEPGDIDFVTYFLLAEPEGYCTYFASAMTVLCRMAGLPARYVEGFLAQTADGEATLTGMNAHAWTEVYFEGFGWLTMDATPREGDTQSGDGEQNNPPQPSPSPSPSPSPDPQDAPTPTPPPDDPPTPSPSPTPSEEPEASPPPEPEAPQSSFPWWLLLLLLALIALCVWRYLWTEPMRRAGREKDPRKALLVYDRALRALAGARGLKDAPGDTLLNVYEAASGLLHTDMSRVAALVCDSVYGRVAPSEAALADVRELYNALWKKLPRRQRIFISIRRMAGMRS